MTAPASTLIHVESRFSLNKLRQSIATRKIDLTKQIAAGLAADMADYRYRVGVLTGLDEALHLIDEMEKNERN